MIDDLSMLIIYISLPYAGIIQFKFSGLSQPYLLKYTWHPERLMFQGYTKNLFGLCLNRRK